MWVSLEKDHVPAKPWGDCNQENRLTMTSQQARNLDYPVKPFMDFQPTKKWDLKMYHFKLLNLENFVAQSQLAITILLVYERQAQWTEKQIDCNKDSKKPSFPSCMGTSGKQQWETEPPIVINNNNWEFLCASCPSKHFVFLNSFSSCNDLWDG